MQKLKGLCLSTLQLSFWEPAVSTTTAVEYLTFYLSKLRNIIKEYNFLNV